MIFYFSATGNSKYVAQRLAGATGERLVFLRDAVRSRAYHYDLSRQERLGFVVPTYFFGLPSILTFFLKKLALNGYEDQYIYLVLTCGSTTAGAGSQMRKLLKEKGLTLSAQFAVPMVDNYVPMFKIADQEAIEQKLDAAEAYIDEACAAILARGTGDYDRCQGHFPGALTAVAYQPYAHGRSTRPFLVTDACVSCGLCQELCPCGAITMSEGRPVWSKPQCVRCLACLHRCPTRAIRWKSPGEDQGRYYNPRVEP